MIVNWNKPNAGVKFIPAQMRNGVINGQVILLPGNNEVPDDTWNLCKHNLKNDPERDFIKEVCVEKIVDSVPNTLREEFVEVVYGKDLKDLTLIQLEDFLRQNNLYEAAILQAEARKVDFDKKFILSLIEQSGENLTQKILNYFGISGNKKYKISTSLSLKELDANKALEIVQDTWNINTLESWRKLESRDEIRSAIMNQIEEVNRPPAKAAGGV